MSAAIRAIVYKEKFFDVKKDPMTAERSRRNVCYILTSRIGTGSHLTYYLPFSANSMSWKY